MVNEAYLNRLSAGLLQSVFDSDVTGWIRSAHGEVAEVDRLDPVRLRIDQQGADRERDAVRNPAFLGVQPQQPDLPRERIRQRPLPELEQQQRQAAAEHRRIEQIVHEMAKAEP